MCFIEYCDFWLRISAKKIYLVLVNPELPVAYIRWEKNGTGEPP